MLRNIAKEKLRKGKVVAGFGVTMPCTGLAQVLCASGADFLTIDLEHGSLGLADVHGLVAATASSDCVPLVRVPAAQCSELKPVLDAGALGIVYPMVRSADELATGIQAASYPPVGKRGIGHHFAPARWGVPASEYLAHANDALLKIALIETAEAVADIREILKVPGLDVVTIAPGDLAASLGHRGDHSHPTVQEAVREIEAAVGGSGVVLGGVPSGASDARAKIGAGYRMLVLGFDVGLMQSAASSLIAAALE